MALVASFWVAEPESDRLPDLTSIKIDRRPDPIRIKFRIKPLSSAAASWARDRAAVEANRTRSPPIRTAIRIAMPVRNWNRGCDRTQFQTRIGYHLNALDDVRSVAAIHRGFAETEAGRFFCGGQHLTRTFRRMLGATPLELKLQRQVGVGIRMSIRPSELLWPAAIIAWGPGYASDRHSHHSVQLVIALEGHLRIRGASSQRWVECSAVLVKADIPHQIDASEARVLLVLVDPQSDFAAALTDAVEEDIQPISDEKVRIWRGQLGDAAALTSAKVAPWVKQSLLADRRKPQLHPKLSRVLEVIREDLGTNRRLSLGRMAAVAGLSESRFIHVFTRSLGVPPRQYILWLRMQRACDELRGGATATQAAHRAGFADGAHLSRTIRRMMGTRPADLIRRRPAWQTAFASDNDGS